MLKQPSHKPLTPPVPQIFSVVSAGVPTYELLVNGVLVQRRAADSCINAGQVLLAAGLSEQRQARILERELGHAGGSGTCWIALDECIMLARRHGVYDSLVPLLMLNARKDNVQLKPLNVLLKDIKRSLSPATIDQEIIKRLKPSSQPHSRASSNDMFFNRLNVAPHAIRPIIESSESVQSSDAREILAQQQRQIMLQIYTDANPYTIQNLMRFTPMSAINYNMVIDDSGHTAAHWTASLGRIHLLQSFVKAGIDLLAENHFGETPLVRSVTTDNNYDQKTFPELLEILSDNVFSVDKKRYSIMHQLAFLSKNRSRASLYYMDCIRNHIGTAHAKLSLLVNSKDRTGDTPLHLACRVGAIPTIEMLLEMGARRDIKNLAQKTPDDCVDPFSDAFKFLYPDFEDKRGSESDGSDATPSPINSPRTEIRSILSVLSTKAGELVDSIHSSFKSKLTSQCTKLNSLQTEHFLSTSVLAQERESNTILANNHRNLIRLESESDSLKLKIANLMTQDTLNKVNVTVGEEGARLPSSVRDGLVAQLHFIERQIVEANLRLNEVGGDLGGVGRYDRLLGIGEGVSVDELGLISRML